MTNNEKERATARATQSQNQINVTTKKPQWQVVLDELFDHYDDGITSWDMIVNHHITRTAACIATLKKKGYNIVSIIETNNGSNYARYFLDDEEDDEEEDDDDDEKEFDIDSLIQSIWEETGRWVTAEQLEASERYDAYCEWRNR